MIYKIHLKDSLTKWEEVMNYPMCHSFSKAHTNHCSLRSVLLLQSLEGTWRTQEGGQISRLFSWTGTNQTKGKNNASTMTSPFVIAWKKLALYWPLDKHSSIHRTLSHCTSDAVVRPMPHECSPSVTRVHRIIHSRRHTFQDAFPASVRSCGRIPVYSNTIEFTMHVLLVVIST